MEWTLLGNNSVTYKVTMERIKISVIIPVYNVAPYITDCLRSVMRQSYQGSIECLIIDDCGTDNSMEVVNSVLNDYNGKIDFKVLHHECNRGLSAARNTGIASATGDYLYFLDSDDELTDNCLELLAAPLNDTAYDFVIGGYKITGSAKSYPSVTLHDGAALHGEDIVKSYYRGEWYMMACGKLCNAEFLKDNQLLFKEGLLHEDELWSFQLACLARSMYVVNKESYIYKIREGSITMCAEAQRRKVKALRTILQESVQFVLEKGIKSPYACLKTYTIFENLCNIARLNSCSRDIVCYRQILAVLSYGRRVKSCLVGIKEFVRFSYVCLPVCAFPIHNRLFFWGVKYKNRLTH